MKEPGIKRGQPITFRIPSDTPDHMLKYLQQLKKMERRNFSSKIAEFVMNGVSGTLSKQKETLIIPLPKSLSKAQKDWLKHEHSEALLGSIVYQLLANPVRTTSLFASLNSNALDIDDALYLQEETAVAEEQELEMDLTVVKGLENESKKQEQALVSDIEMDDLDQFDWETAKDADSESHEEGS